MKSVMEQYLRAHIDYQQDNWVALLTTREFAVNNPFSETLRTSPFMANYRCHHCFVDSLAPLRKVRPETQAQDLVHQLAELHTTLQAELGLAQSRQAGYANSSRLPAPRYLPGD